MLLVGVGQLVSRQVVDALWVGVEVRHRLLILRGETEDGLNPRDQIVSQVGIDLKLPTAGDELD
jgi:hypothetical protein